MTTIGLYLKATHTTTHCQGVWGDSLWASAICKGLNKIPEVKAYCFGENMGFMPETDIAIYFNLDNVAPDSKLLGKQKNIAIMQNFSEIESIQSRHLNNCINFKGDKVFTISKYFSLKYSWEMLYPCVDLDEFKPYKKDDRFLFDLLYIGNNIKDPKKSAEYLGIAGIKYGIFGNGYGQPISWKDSLRAYSSAKLCLNYGFDASKEIITARIFQIAACRGLIITEWLDPYEEVFGDSIFYIKPGENVGAKIKEALETPEEKKKLMLDRAYKIVSENYNCEVQAKRLYDLIIYPNVGNFPIIGNDTEEIKDEGRTWPVGSKSDDKIIPINKEVK